MKPIVLKTGLILPLLMILFFTNLSAKDPVYTGFFNNKAISGYDAVAYFKNGKPVEGRKEFKTQYQGASWYFSSQLHLQAFLDQPEKYAPQYGGYCAWAVAQGDTAKGDPHQWTIFNQKLYLNYNTEIQERWLKDKAALIVKGDKNWPAVVQ